MSKTRYSSTNEKTTVYDVPPIVDESCKLEIRNIISASKGNIFEMSRLMYAKNYGDIIFYPWCTKPFDVEDPETYCNGLEIETTNYFFYADNTGLQMSGTRLVTVWLLEDGTIHDIKIDAGDIWLDEPSDEMISYINELKEFFAENPELLKPLDSLLVDNQKGE